MSDWQWCPKHKHKFYGYQCDLCSGQNQINDGKVKRKYVRKHKISIYERFHNYGVKFTAQVFWDAILIEPSRLNPHVYFKRLDFPDAIVKVFRRSILVTLRASREIKGMKVRDAERKSIELINKVLDQLPKSIQVHDRSVVNVHNAFANHPTANHDVTVKVNDEVRIISDHSKGVPEFEAVHPGHVVSDSEILERFNADLISKPSLPLSVLTEKIGLSYDVLSKFATQIELHLDVEERTLSTLDKISDGIDSIIKIAKPKRVVRKGSLGMTSPRCHR